MNSVAGYASKIADMVSLTSFFKHVPAPPTPEGLSDEKSDDEKAEATADDADA